jgi:ABC-type Fe3+-siderophore transport system permease subunit
MTPRVNKWLDLLDRAGWTAIQASAAAVIVFATSGTNFSWQTLFTFVGSAAAIAVVKVIVGQRTGGDETGALIGQPVIEPAPANPPSP